MQSGAFVIWQFSTIWYCIEYCNHKNKVRYWTHKNTTYYTLAEELGQFMLSISEDTDCVIEELHYLYWASVY